MEDRFGAHCALESVLMAAFDNDHNLSVRFARKRSTRTAAKE
ncbi:hypothetical protein [Paraburkholderia aromaticivorans]|nr:hypothetical protein [Paraburkholderia aromaticivorans]